jgi:hypothetical protein
MDRGAEEGRELGEPIPEMERGALDGPAADRDGVPPRLTELALAALLPAVPPEIRATEDEPAGDLDVEGLDAAEP